MQSPILQLLVLAGIAVFLILRLKNVLGTRDGFESPSENRPELDTKSKRSDFEVIEGSVDRDIADHAEDGSDTAQALHGMKRVEPSFGVGDFLQGARGAYEMILMGFERGDLASIKPFLDDDVYESFAEVVEAREKKGLTVEAEFGGIREMALEGAEFDPVTNLAEVSVRFVGELSSVVRDKSGKIIEGKTGAIKRQKDVWTFARTMASNDPNWQLVATGE